MAQRSALITVITDAVLKVSRRLARDFAEVNNLQVSMKGPADFVSTADTTAEKKLVEALRAARPNYGFLLEEKGEIEGKDTHNRWIIDPLDGTTNFLHGLPHFAISVALERDGEIVAGVIFDPAKNEMFTAEKGQGAYLNGNRLRVSGRKDMANSIFATGIPFLGRPGHEVFLKEAEAVMAVSAGIRRFGAASLDLAYVAAGRFDGFWETGLKSWDIAAGIIMVREAGGFVTEINGKRDMLKSGSILAANDQIHAELGSILKKAAKTTT